MATQKVVTTALGSIEGDYTIPGGVNVNWTTAKKTPKIISKNGHVIKKSINAKRQVPVSRGSKLAVGGNPKKNAQQTTGLQGQQPPPPALLLCFAAALAELDAGAS